jgi:hypothetical protein
MAGVLSKLRSRFSGQSAEEFGFGQRYPIDASMRKSINFHINRMINQDLTGYTFERRHSNYPNAKSDIVIYDANDKPVLHGREFNGGNNKVTFWE